MKDAPFISIEIDKNSPNNYSVLIKDNKRDTIYSFDECSKQSLSLYIKNTLDEITTGDYTFKDFFLERKPNSVYQLSKKSEHGSFVVAFLTWDKEYKEFNLESVFTRLIDHYEDGLMDWLNVVKAELREELIHDVE